MNNQFEESIKALGSPREEADYLAQALRYCAEKIMLFGNNNTEALVEELENQKAQNEKLNIRIKNAEQYFHSTKNMVDSAEERVKASTARKLQKSCDELYVLGNALHAYAAALSMKATAKMTLDEVNNLQQSVLVIIDNLQENGLWNEQLNMKPDLTWVEKVERPKKTKKTKKNKEAVEQLTIPVGLSQEQQEG